MSNVSLGKRLSSLFVFILFCGLPTLLFFQNCSSSFKVMPLPEKVDPVVFSVPQIEFIDPVILTIMSIIQRLSKLKAPLP
jgi:hypothetical protein